jgi:hypothetical protein
MGVSDDAEKMKRLLAQQRRVSVDGSMIDDLVEAGTWGLAESHALHNHGHSVTVILDRSFDNPDVRVIRIACSGSPERFMDGGRDCDYWEEVPIE